MSMRQREILLLLKEHRGGLSIPRLEGRLRISRTAINQHLTNLERDGLVSKGHAERTGGRPGYVYLITGKGIEQLPKQYSWFSELMLDALKDKLGADGLKSLLREVAANVGQQLESRLNRKPLNQQIEEVNTILNEFGYEAQVTPAVGGELPMISAKNCVYHKLAERHPEVCEFDIALMSQLLQHTVEHVECMVRDGARCRFRVEEKPTDSLS